MDLYTCPIADPLASDKMNKKLLKIIKKGHKSKLVKRGIKETVKAIKKKNKGICVIGADISPIDVISHLPILCEDFGIPYIYSRSRLEIGVACKTKRPTSCIFMSKPSSKSEKELAGKFETIAELIKERNPYFQ